MTCRSRRPAGLWAVAVLLAGTAPFLAGDPPADLERAAFAKCSLADKLLAAAKADDARRAVAGFIDDPALAASRYRGLGLYYHGLANFVLKDYPAAGRSLNLAVAAGRPEFVGHARYLLARVHHLADERAEALAQYEVVVAAHEGEKAEPPEHIGRAAFYLGTLLFEGGRFPEARERFAQLLAGHPQSPLRSRARLFQAYCDVYLEQFPEAIAALKDLANKERSLAGPALVWLARAEAAAADPDDRAPALGRAMTALREAAERLTGARRGDALIELAELHRQAGEHREAAALLDRVAGERLNPGRDEEVLQRRVTALNLAGDFAGSRALAAQFLKRYPQSVLLPEVLLRAAENAAFLTDDGEAARTYQAVIDRFPESPHANLARLGAGLLAYRARDWDRARVILEGIPAGDRQGELGLALYLLADCQLRLAPTDAEDALAAGRLLEQLNGAAGLLEGFVTEQPSHPLATEALLRLGVCQERLASLQANGEERGRLIRLAQSSYERVLVEYPLTGPRALAGFLRVGPVVRAEGASESAVRQLRLFASDPLLRDPVAPLALLRLATLYRSQAERAGEAVRVMALALRRHEEGVRKDPAATTWSPLLHYHHGVALLEAGRSAEARAVFERLRKEYPDRPESAEAIVRLGQGLVEEGWRQMDRGGQLLGTPGIKPADARAAEQVVAEGRAKVRAGLAHFEAEAAPEKKIAPSVRARLLYQAAWLRRGRADEEFAAAREKARQGAPETPVGQIELQPTDQKVIASYRALIAAAPDSSLAADARLELAELYADRGKHAPAAEVLREALDKEPPDELADRARLRLADCLIALGDAKAAVSRFEVVAAREGSPWAPHGQYRAGEALMRQGRWAEAAEKFTAFRDKEPLKGLGGLSDLALLRLGHALIRLDKPADARKAFEVLQERFGDSGGVPDARYGVGWIHQQRRDFDKAVEAYRAADGDAATETAARAHIQIAVCEIEQGRPADALATLKGAVERYPFPELRALALLEAAHARRRLNQGEEVEKLLRQLLRDHPGSPWATAAREQLAEVGAGPTHRPAAARLLTPDLKPPPLDPLSYQQPERASLDDPAEEAARALVLARVPPKRERAFDSPVSVVPDPYEHREAVRIDDPPPDGRGITIDLSRIAPPR